MVGQDSMTASVSPARRRLTVEFRRAAGFVPAGVAILQTEDVAMTVSSLHCISLDPPMISVALSRDARKSGSILASGGFHVRVLRNGEEDLAKGEGIACGAGMVEMDCTIATKYTVGDHDLVVANVASVTVTEGYPTVYWRRGLHVLRPRYGFVTSRESLEEFVAAWEGGALPRSQWTHAGHVAVGAYYAVCYPSSAFERTKTGILRYNQAAGIENGVTTGYHETLTRFWANLLGKFVGGFTDSWSAAFEAAEKFGEERDLHHLYYSFDVVRNTQARREWIPPDMEGPY
jgi:flavin reductase (DIM6/NTAB) family NADH-FMN oxidoreductase RutF